MLLHVQRLLRRFEGLRGAEVISWKGVEMAFTEGREGGEFWDDKSVPYLQMHLVDISRKDGAMFRIATEQADLLFGYNDREPIPGANQESDWKGIFRERTLDELPVGRISRLEVAVENELIDRVTFFIGSCQVRISAGEIYEENDSTLRIVPKDESVLVQVDGAHPRLNKRIKSND